MFENRTVLITGAAAGLGAAAAEAFAAKGATLILSDRSDKVMGVAERLGATGLIADAASLDDHKMQVAKAVEQTGHLDITINNAGIAHPPMRIEQTPEQVARMVVEVDLLGMMWALQTQIPQMQKQALERDGDGGCILNVASIAGLVGASTLGIYGAAKHGVVGLTKAAAIENARRGIRVNAICPGFTRTAMTGDLINMAPDAEAAEADMVRGVPMRRLGEQAEIVSAMLFAASPENSFMTGQTIALDGGVTAY
ncbi:SDR family NAD(P)-dependent oxidoreductase [Pontivivens insulae]|uniref:Putative oxidoreductase n=1 Tax=Pontivivens insulae TaxID=1639689 RepID=A0A2R8AF54_9RHOB|nr:SDR family oxidoreductase [Pontivivens insulae]RED12071.1 NAD(P)-dependent dehydrogenase (short-subunit alcohol dehydrogenase family) [Pontivivens insulae]SPF30827.1 putative oxidoreductase [Pontivivens insulae]